MGLTKVRGTFSEVQGTIAFDEQLPTRSSVTVVVKIKSLDTNNERRDRHLKSADFFDAEKYPTATFSSSSIVSTPDGYLVHGALSFHGVTREVAIPFSYLGHVVDEDSSGHRLGFDGALDFDRRDFGIVGPAEYNKLTSFGKLTIGEKVQLTLSIQGRLSTPKRLQDPIADSLYRRVMDRGVKTVAKEYRALRGQTPDSLMAVRQPQLDRLGQFLLQTDRVTDALDVFGLEVEAFPDQPTGHVGLGQALATAGDRARAIESCQKGLALNPDATRARGLLRRLNRPRD